MKIGKSRDISDIRSIVGVNSDKNSDIKLTQIGKTIWVPVGDRL